MLHIGNNSCLTCYGAEDTAGQCCNTCDEVGRATCKVERASARGTAASAFSPTGSEGRLVQWRVQVTSVSRADLQDGEGKRTGHCLAAQKAARVACAVAGWHELQLASL